MRNLPPNSPDLPVTRNMPFTTKSVPSKAQPRNMTGIYLGLVSTKFLSSVILIHHKKCNI